jgi:hypothetical protein
LIQEKETNSKIKILNLYAGLGGNRKLWKNVEVTAVENNPEIAKIYQDFDCAFKEKQSTLIGVFE